MRYDAEWCGKCGYRTPAKNRIGFVLGPVAALILMIVAIGLIA